MNNIVVVLPNIRSAENVGAMFRTADAAGVSRIVLAGYTPSPIDRFGRARKDIAKAALGAEQTIPWKAVPTLAGAIDELKREGYFVVAIEQSTGATRLRDAVLTVRTKENIAFVFGNEVTGLSSEDLALMDLVVEIPMYGKKESLNVAASCAVALYVLLER